MIFLALFDVVILAALAYVWRDLKRIKERLTQMAAASVEDIATRVAKGIGA